MRVVTPFISAFNEQFASAEHIHRIEGIISEEMLSTTLKDVETRFENDGSDSKKSRKVYNILVETLQNLFHHTGKYTDETLPNGDSKRAVLLDLVFDGTDYHILSANYMLSDNIPLLRARLEKINALDKDGLRDFYKEVLDNGQYSIHGGGGLGMIDIARKSGNPLEFEFSNPVGNYEVFVLKIKV